MGVFEQKSQIISEIEHRGYVVIENHLASEMGYYLTSLLETEVNDTTSEPPYLGFDKCHIHDLLVRYPHMLSILDDELLDSVFGYFLGEFWVMYAATSSSIPPQEQNFASRIHVDSPRLVEGYPFNMGAIWTLTDYSRENGCLEVLPHSHLSEKVPSLEEFENNKIEILCKKNALILFNARLYHRTTPNNAQHWRHAMTMNACRSFMKQRLDWVRFFGSDKVAEYSPRLRRILGFDTRVPANMDEFSQPEHLRYYKSNQG